MTDTKRAPRQTNADLTHNIYTAAIAILDESGYEEVTFTNVAKRAGTGRPTLYRRWESPFALLQAAQEYFADNEVDSFGDVDFSGRTMRANLLATLGHFDASPQFMRAFLIELGRDTPSVQKFFTEMRKQDLFLMERLLSQAQLDGEINHTVTDDVKIMPFSLLIYQAMIERQPVSTTFVEQLVDNIVIPAIMAQQN